MNTTSVSTAAHHTVQYYLEKEQAVFSTIPGMDALLHADRSTIAELEHEYPDAAFALMTADNLFAGDREQNIIHQKAYAAILRGDSIPNVRFRYDRDMEDYVQRHMWD
ncbi:MAG: hypothetical protein J6J18_00560 [Oscillospiraceae bacterium]|nr:hypothetical protein [Oscillospiraceae bacterium]